MYTYVLAKHCVCIVYVSCHNINYCIVFICVVFDVLLLELSGM